MKRDIFIRLLTSRSAALPPNTLVFNSQTPGSYSVDVKKGIYLLEISGGGGAPHGGNGADPGAGGAGTTLAVTWGGNGANGIVKLTYISKIPN